MLKLCAKDFIAGRWLWLLVIATDILYLTFPLQKNLGLMVGALALVLGCMIATLFLEDRNKTEAFYSSLPLKRSTMVLSRYALTGFLAFGGGLFVFGYGYFLDSIAKLRFVRIDLRSLMTFESLAGFIVFTAFIAGLYYPFYYKHGLGRGSFIFAAVLLALAVIFTGLERLAAGVLYLTRPLFTEEFLKDPGLGIVRVLGGVENALGQPLFIGSALILTAGMLIVSIRLSIRFYEKRDF